MYVNDEVLLIFFNFFYFILTGELIGVEYLFNQTGRELQLIETDVETEVEDNEIGNVTEMDQDPTVSALEESPLVQPSLMPKTSSLEKLPTKKAKSVATQIEEVEDVHDPQVIKQFCFTKSNFLSQNFFQYIL
jgi:hypothetical protein